MIRTALAMGTTVTIQTVDRDDAGARIDRAFAWIREVEARCTRFDPDSEAMRLTTRVGTPVPASDILFEAVRFALAVADASHGAFDPTVGHLLHARGFNRHYRSGEIGQHTIEASPTASFRDIAIDAVHRTITLRQPIVLDLGAVAKGLAIDLAARELGPLGDFAIDAGGDLYFGGRGPGGRPWTAGIRHPRQDGGLLCALTLTDAAVCTSGDYERRTAAGHHLIDARSGACAGAAISASVIAPTAMVADALATAAFVLGPEQGVSFLEANGVDGLIVSASLEQHATRGFAATFGGSTVLRHAQGPAHHRAAGAVRRRRSERRRSADRSGAA